MTPDGQRFLYLVFEVVSALATVGVTANVTSTLNGAGLGIIMVLMFIGRIGPLTLMVSLNNYKAKKADGLCNMLKQTSLSDRRNLWQIEPLEF